MISDAFPDSCFLDRKHSRVLRVSKFYLHVCIMKNSVVVSFGAVFLCLPACYVFYLALCHASAHLGMHSKDHGVFFFKSLCQQTFITAYTLPDTTLNSEDECNRSVLQRDSQCNKSIRTRKRERFKRPFH